MRKKSNKNFKQNKYYRLNERISAPTLRLLDNEGKQIGIFTKFEALQKARELAVDVVEVAPGAKPPVAKLIDFNKFLYQEEKKRREEKRKAKTSETKEVRLGPFMSDNDLSVMIKRGREFLEDGDKLRLVVKFKGRQITRPEFGKVVIAKVVEALEDISKVEKEPRFEGRQLVAILSLERKKQNAEEKNKKISIQEVPSNENGQSNV